MLKTRAATALLACSGAVFYASNPAWAQAVDSAAPPLNRVTLSASASTEITHDWLQIRLGTQREGADAAGVQRLLQSDVQSALSVLRPLQEVGQFQVSSGPVNVSLRYDRNGKPSGWAGSAELWVEGRDVARISQAAADVKGLVVKGMQFSLSPSARTAVEAELQAQAIERFKTKAKHTAQLFGFGGYQLVQVQVGSTDQGAYPRQPYLAMAARSTVADAAPPMAAEPGRTLVQLTVSGTVQLR